VVDVADGFVSGWLLMLLVDLTIVNVALPSIASDLDASLSDLQWTIEAYPLSLAALLLVTGSLGDRIGHRNVFAGGLVIFTIASLLCGLATDALFLNLSRAAQGIGGAAMFASSLALIAQEFKARERGTAFGVFGATAGASLALGPLVVAGARHTALARARARVERPDLAWSEAAGLRGGRGSRLRELSVRGRATPLTRRNARAAWRRRDARRAGRSSRDS
jgi:MFS family permease